MEIILLYVLGTTPNLLPEIFGAKPTLLLCVALTAAIFEREIPAMVIGMICGILTDLGYSNGIGLFTISLTVICFIVGYAANNLVVATFTDLSAVRVCRGRRDIHAVLPHTRRMGGRRQQLGLFYESPAVEDGADLCADGPDLLFE